MTDPLDLAAELEADQRDHALAAQRQRAGLADPARWNDASLKWCAGCGQRIPDERRQALPGVRLCTACARDADHHAAAQARQGRGR